MADPRVPNFLIVGAAKAGTTSLYSYLADCPDVALSDPKEPKYFSAQHLQLPQAGPGDAAIDAARVTTRDAYLALFAQSEGCPAVGEASADNLYYHAQVIPQIQALCGDPKIIIILRDPVARAISAYQYQYQQRREDRTFAEALGQEEARLAANWEFIWAYRQGGLYAEAVAAYQAAFSQVKILLTEELQADPVGVINDIRGFLGLPTRDTLSVQAPSNTSQAVPRSVRLMQWRRGEGRVGQLMSWGRRVLPPSARTLLRRRVNEWSHQARPDFSAERRALAAFYAPDVHRLRQILGKPLTGWPE